MPYIDPILRQRTDLKLRALFTEVLAWHSGELAYVLYRIAKAWLGGNPDYSRLATFTGVVEETLAEVRRRMTVPYEKRKRRENGDV